MLALAGTNGGTTLDTTYAREAWWLPAHVTWRFFGVSPAGVTAWFPTLDQAQAWER